MCGNLPARACFAPSSPTTHYAPLAVQAQVTAPLQRRLSVPSLAGRGGRRAAGAGRNVRRALAQVTGAGRATVSRVSGTCAERARCDWRLAPPRRGRVAGPHALIVQV